MLKEDPTWVLDDFVDVRTDPDNKKGFFAFYDIAVTAVCGRRNWTKNIKLSQTICQCGKVTVSDEAYAELVIKNYWNRWKEGGDAQWTDGRSGNLLQHGWSSKGHAHFNEIYVRIKAQRRDDESRRKADSKYMEMAQATYGGTKPKRKIGGEMDGEEEVKVDEW
jgi:hypothetical protein